MSSDLVKLRRVAEHMLDSMPRSFVLDANRVLDAADYIEHLQEIILMTADPRSLEDGVARAIGAARRFTNGRLERV